MLVVTEGIFRGPRSCPRHNTSGGLSRMAGLGSFGERRARGGGSSGSAGGGWGEVGEYLPGFLLAVMPW